MNLKQSEERQCISPRWQQGEQKERATHGERKYAEAAIEISASFLPVSLLPCAGDPKQHYDAGGLWGRKREGAGRRATKQPGRRKNNGKEQQSEPEEAARVYGGSRPEDTSLLRLRGQSESGTRASHILELSETSEPRSGRQQGTKIS